MTIWVWLKMKRSEGQPAGGCYPCFHLGQPISEFRFFEPQPYENTLRGAKRLIDSYKSLILVTGTSVMAKGAASSEGKLN